MVNKDMRNNKIYKDRSMKKERVKGTRIKMETFNVPVDILNKDKDINNVEYMITV